MDLILAYVAGLLTLLNPCVLPVLPIVLATSLGGDRLAPVALAAGMSLSVVALGTGVAAVGPALGITQERIVDIAAIAMVAFGLVMLVPAFGRSFAFATAGLASRADAGMNRTVDRGLGGHMAGGVLLGAVWSPCIGPTLGAAIALASTGERLGHAAAIMTAFALGVSTLIVLGAYAAHGWMSRNTGRLAAISARAKPLLGIVFVGVGLALYFRLNHIVDAWLIEVMPAWLIDLSVAV
jgi:cytochrome c-type biogenesis protein